MAAASSRKPITTLTEFSQPPARGSDLSSAGKSASTKNGAEKVFRSLDAYIRLGDASEKPMLFVRGNHETIGNFADKMAYLFDMPALEASAKFADQNWYYTLKAGPVWLLALWAMFATALRGPLAWLSGRYVLSALLGAVFAAPNYFAGARLGAVVINPSGCYSVLVLALSWAAAMPLLVWLAHGAARKKKN